MCDKLPVRVFTKFEDLEASMGETDAEREAREAREKAEREQAAREAATADLVKSFLALANLGTIPLPAQQQAAVATNIKVGKTYEFIPGGVETWEIYIERLEEFFNSNTISDPERKKSTLLTVMGTEAYFRLRSLSMPKKPTELSYVECVEMLAKFYDPKPNMWVKRDKFWGRVQKESETVSQFLAELNGLSEHCQFENLEQALLGQVLKGLRDMKLKEQILQIPDLTFAKVQQRALAAEAARNDVLSFQGGQTPGERNVHRVAPGQQAQGHRGNAAAARDVTPARSSQPAKRKPCYRCGVDNHKSDKCRFKDSTCGFCSKTGHSEQVCWSKHPEKKKEGPPRSNSRGRGGHRGGRGRQQNAHYCEEQPRASTSQTISHF